ncbi:CrcB family protein [Microbacterium sp. cf332]|uniref:fluoride efflux transporter FluC n=1 Tax=Microbacterium sp. cf332 TaxID=1761804 RepID=UPI0008868EEC|nr:CrcB family protein [Microbacterium sp. cf332]SDQ61996.1 CrcB protein [Microbacterium sp. cf332]
MVERVSISPLTLILVVVGGAAGVAARAALTLPFGGWSHPLVVPALTLGCNILGSFLLGIVVGRWGTRRPRLRAFVGTGVLGGFTTYSAFAVQSIQVATNAPVVGLALVLASLIGGLLAAALGLSVGARREADA